MAEAIWNESSLKLMFLNGMKENGDPNYITKTFKNVKQTATPEQLDAVAAGLSSLVTYTLFSIERNDVSEIIQP
ncbi:DUF1659 domain-containing protein [Niallia sp. JL1B1071]|uniref:DUF1659 domain-containing protein n=1 Tax=Niallia tiangongensis TaxID=3237105 RepID=UPI0037DC53B7